MKVSFLKVLLITRKLQKFLQICLHFFVFGPKTGWGNSPPSSPPCPYPKTLGWGISPLSPPFWPRLIKYHVSVTNPQLLTCLIFDTFVKFYKYYKMSVSKLERDKLSSVLSRRLLLNWWIDWAQTFRIFFLLIESYLDHCLTFKL